MNQQELNKVCSRLEKRLEFLERGILNYSYCIPKKSEQLQREYNLIQDKISSLCAEFRRNN